MNLPITAFEVMAAIAKENGIRGTRGMSPSRTSDFKRLAKKTKAGAAEPDQEHDIWKHTFSLNTFFTLWDGMRRLVGCHGTEKRSDEAA